MATSGGRAECPNCHRLFDTAATVVCHLNHSYSSCAIWLLPPDPQPNPPSNPVQNGPEVPPPMKFPFSGHVFTKGEDFIDRFHTDKFAEHCAENIYYPFASREEWELGAFLSQSNMSMKIIDEFLSLELVSLRPDLRVRLSHLKITRYVVSTFLFKLQRHFVVLWNSSPLAPSGCPRKSTFQATPQRIQLWFITAILLNACNGFSRTLYIPTVSNTPQNIGPPLMGTASIGTGLQVIVHG